MTAYREGAEKAAPLRRQYAFSAKPRSFALLIVGFLGALAVFGRLVFFGDRTAALIAGLVAIVLFYHADRARTLYERNGAYLDVKRGLSRMRIARLHVDVGAEVSVVIAGNQAFRDDGLEIKAVHLIEVATPAGNKVVAEVEDDRTADTLAAALRTVVGPPQPG